MKSFKKILVILIAIAFSSCSTFYIGTTTGDASLSSNNFKMMRLATGTASIHTFMGIGGMKKEALVHEAKKDMLLNSPLKERQALANVTVDFKTSFFLVFRTQKVTVSADIVEFIDRTPEKSSNKIPDNKPVEKKSVDNKPGDNKSDAKKPVDSKPDKISNTSQPIENIPVPKVIKMDKDTTSSKPVNNPPSIPVPEFVPTISYSAPAEIVTSSGVRYKVEIGDYFIGTLNEKGNPENGKLYDKNGRPKHVILPRRNH